jgi:hypothetical protein
MYLAQDFHSQTFLSMKVVYEKVVNLLDLPWTELTRFPKIPVFFVWLFAFLSGGGKEE